MDSHHSESHVKLLGFHKRRRHGIFRLPKGGGGRIRDGWGYSKELTRDGAHMTYTFKLSRRLARIREAALAVAVISAISCTDDGISGPDSNAVPNDLSTVTLSPDSTAIGVNQSVQFEALIGSRQLPYQWGTGFSPRLGR